MSQIDADLEGVRVGLFLAPEGTEEVEFTEPRDALTDAGATVEVLGSETGEARTVNDDLEWSDSYEVEKTFSEVSADGYDALVIPGGTVGADTLRTDEGAVELLREHVVDGMPVGAICHGPWLLVEADVIAGKRLTSYPSLRTDIENAGGDWHDDEVIVDGEIITSRTPDDLPAFCETLIEECSTTAR
ncbi:type 1 glutamine amidotransferase domain-containing protein [Natrononativus amylolyticus]|uniref:type 1 glutamine amidotransferase domain-containing protein n=1 Tax=Natrononativus amylolyticus TaxID=2963434 RepID=UPI0020CC9B8B|nr:type 1 glutamine amidotransferase domain-containing protein [Natrononativus amylolyticus]